jgi:beta-lactamase class A
VADFVGGDAGRSALVGTVDTTVGVAEAVPRPGASLLKLPVALAVHDGAVDPSATVAVGDLPASRWPSIVDAFEPDHRFTVAELTSLMLATSDNRTADHLLALVGADAVADVLDRLGCVDTRLAIGFGDDDLEGPGLANETSATDAVRLLGHVAATPALAPLRRALEAGRPPPRIQAYLPPATVVANKSGTLEGVVDDIGLVRTPAGDLVMAFLTQDQPDRAATSLAIGRCARAVYDAHLAA